jgi:hypothetical protein
MKLLNEEKNPFYKHARIKLFFAQFEGKIVGRIAAITNQSHNDIHQDNIGFFGFFECVDNQQVANELFKTAEEWLKKEGKDAIRGPLNPSINDELGLLVEGFEDSPRILMTYNPKYYSNLIEKYGFAKVKDLFAYKLQYKKFASEKLKRMQGIVRERFQITVRPVDFKHKDQFRKDIDLIKDIYNKAWQPNWGFVKLNDDEFEFLANDLKQIAWPSLAFLAYVKGVPAGFHLGLPDLNQVFKYNRSGSMLGAAWNMLTKKKQITWMRIIILGVLPEFQKNGVDAVLYWESAERSNLVHLNDAEASWILEDNEMMNKGLTVTMDGELYKKYRIYEKKI